MPLLVDGQGLELHAERLEIGCRFRASGGAQRTLQQVAYPTLVPFQIRWHRAPQPLRNETEALARQRLGAR